MFTKYHVKLLGLHGEDGWFRVSYLMHDKVLGVYKFGVKKNTDYSVLKAWGFEFKSFGFWADESQVLGVEISGG